MKKMKTRVEAIIPKKVDVKKSDLFKGLVGKK
jgi:hypothetical protein